MKKLLIRLIEMYQKHISKWLESKNINCKFYPTCSEYAITCFERFGFIKGAILAIRRILSCHPWGKSGIDHVPHEFYIFRKK